MTDMKLKNEKERIDLGSTFIMFYLILITTVMTFMEIL